MLFAAVVLFIFLQTIAWRGSPSHPIWGMASDALGQPLVASISVNRDLTTLALIRLITAASAFWIALQLCRNAMRARHFVAALAAIGALYAAYGLVAFALQSGRLPWLEAPAAQGFVTSTFVNHNSFATYAGLALMAACGLVVRQYRHALADSRGGLTVASLIETTGRSGAVLLAGAFIIVVAILLTGSRGGVIASGVGLFVLGMLSAMRLQKRATGQLASALFAVVLVVATLVAFGDIFVGTVAERGLGDTNRMSVYLITLRSILDVPLSGFGYGTFADVFPMYRDRSLSVQGAWQQAHNTYLEIFQGLGLVFGSMFVAAVLLLVLRCAKGAVRRQENATVTRVAVSMACLVGVHALADFSLQIQGVALTFAAALGAGVAQSESSRLVLED
jgi:O-antigen ligase